VPETSPQKGRPAQADSPLGLSSGQKVGLTVGAGILVVGLGLWELFGSWTPAQWSSSAEVATAAVALVAAFVGLRQLREAQTLRQQQEREALAVRREQAQPYVALWPSM
jgi:membrane protein implicated in regulation of membrane protease activity